MKKTKMKAMTFTIPNGSNANTSFPFFFEHETEEGLIVKAMGITEASNPNNVHFNFGLEAKEGTSTLDAISKNFYAATPQTPVNDRFIPIEFLVPGEKRSRVIFTPTQAVGAADVKVQVVFKYEQN
jgi:hypothetical protein